MKEAMEHNATLRRVRAAEGVDEMLEGMKHYRRLLSGAPLVNLNSGIGLGRGRKGTPKTGVVVT